MATCRVLLIDDEIELISTLVERLEIRGMCADAVTSGHDALERMRDIAYDVVVADLKMPGLSGPEVIEIVRKRYPATKILLITGHGRTEQEDITRNIPGVFEILMKPFNINQLMQAIQRALAGKAEGGNT